MSYWTDIISNVFKELGITRIRPASSPYLNPIVHMWYALQKMISRNDHPANVFSISRLMDQQKTTFFCLLFFIFLFYAKMLSKIFVSSISWTIEDQAKIQKSIWGQRFAIDWMYRMFDNMKWLILELKKTWSWRN